MTTYNICFPFVGDSVGGSQIATVVLINTLDQTRYVPRVVVHKAGPLTNYLNKRNIEFQILPLEAYVGSKRSVLATGKCLAKTTPVLSRFLKQSEVSIVHTQDGRMNQTWGLPARIVGKKFVWHQHSMYAPSRLTRLAMILPNQMICVSEFVRQSLPRSIRSDVLKIDNPHDTAADPLDREVSRRQVCQSLELPMDCRIILFLGTLTVQKRPDIFLHAAAAIRRRHGRPVRFLLFGHDRDQMQPQLKELTSQLGIEDAVYFMGFRDPITPWLAAADLLLAPSINEAFGRYLVEAMLTGTPVIASASGGHGEILESERTGILTPPDDPSAMAAAALFLLDNPDRQNEIARQGYEAALTRYSVHTYADTIMDVYDDLLLE